MAINELLGILEMSMVIACDDPEDIQIIRGYIGEIREYIEKQERCQPTNELTKDMAVLLKKKIKQLPARFLTLKNIFSIIDNHTGNTSRSKTR